jgi:hypothetical protein
VLHWQYDETLSHRPTSATSVDSQDSCRWAISLTDRIGTEADAGHVAGALAAIWQEVDAALSPIIGSRGVAALYHRSLFRVAAEHRWLADLPQGALPAIDLGALQSAAAQQSSAEALDGTRALFQTFHQLLTSLIGASLAERLLRSVGAGSGGPPAEDTSR